MICIVGLIGSHDFRHLLLALILTLTNTEITPPCHTFNELILLDVWD